MGAALLPGGVRRVAWPCCPVGAPWSRGRPRTHRLAHPRLVWPALVAVAMLRKRSKATAAAAAEAGPSALDKGKDKGDEAGAGSDSTTAIMLPLLPTTALCILRAGMGAGVGAGPDAGADGAAVPALSPALLRFAVEACNTQLQDAEDALAMQGAHEELAHLPPSVVEDALAAAALEPCLAVADGPAATCLLPFVAQALVVSLQLCEASWCVAGGAPFDLLPAWARVLLSQERRCCVCAALVCHRSRTPSAAATLFVVVRALDVVVECGVRVLCVLCRGACVAGRRRWRRSGPAAACRTRRQPRRPTSPPSCPCAPLPPCVACRCCGCAVCTTAWGLPLWPVPLRRGARAGGLPARALPWVPVPVPVPVPAAAAAAARVAVPWGRGCWHPPWQPCGRCSRDASTPSCGGTPALS
jgi:hypothetical protein